MLTIPAAPVIIKNSCSCVVCTYLDGQLGTLDVGYERNGVLHCQPPCDVSLGDGWGGAVEPHRKVDH